MPLSHGGIAMCQACSVEAQAEGEGIHRRGYHRRRLSRKERVLVPWRRGGRVRCVPQEAFRTAVHPFRCQSRLNRMTVQTTRRIKYNNDLGRREGSTPVPSPPPLASAKAFSRSGYGRIFPLFSRVMRKDCSPARVPGRPEAVSEGPIFSRPVDCASLGNISSRH
jgi:hypothetical protein